MASEAKCNEHEVYSQLKSLAKYLTTKIEVSKCTWEMQVRDERAMAWVTKETAGHIVKVMVSNNAPIEPSWPLVVFTGIGLVVKWPKSTHPYLWKMKKEGNLKVDLTNAPQNNPFPPDGSERENEENYPHLTDTERKQGYALFPCESITYDLRLASKTCPDINGIKIMVEGNVSRRHLFHFIKELEIQW